MHNHRSLNPRRVALKCHGLRQLRAIVVVSMLGQMLGQTAAAATESIKEDVDKLTDVKEMAQFVPDRALSVLKPLEAEMRLAPLTTKAEYLVETSMALRGVGQVSEALTVADEVILLGRQSGNKAVLAKGLLTKAYALFAIKNLSDSHKLIWEAEAAANVSHDVALQVQATISSGQAFAEDGNYPNAISKLQLAVNLARTQKKILPKIMALNAFAKVCDQVKDYEKGLTTLREAMNLVDQDRYPERLAVLKNTEYGLLMDTDQPEKARRALDDALAVERKLRATPLLVSTLINLSDSYLKSHEYANAATFSLQAIQQARQIHHASEEAAALANLAQAQIATGEIAQGRRSYEAALQSYEKTGDLPELQIALREYGNALERVGDSGDAIVQYHRERELSDKLFEARRTKEVWGLQERYEAADRERRIEALSRENRIKSIEILNRRLEQRVSLLLASVLTLTAVIIGLFYRRVRRSNAGLQRMNSELAYKSSHDALTTLYNRRHFQEFIALPNSQRMPSGEQLVDGLPALFIVDIDHFKTINDTFGHAVGDLALVEIAKRLRTALRGTDMIVRWGGEEFLAYLPATSDATIDDVAKRLLEEIGAVPVMHEGTPIRITASIGYMALHLLPNLKRTSWDHAITLVDQALYMAKANGRNRAYGIHGVCGLDEIKNVAVGQTADLEASVREGHLTLSVVIGPLSCVRAAALSF